MGDVVGWIFVALTLAGFGFALMLQIREALAIKRTTKWETRNDKRRLLGHYMMAVSLAGFLISYLLNVAVGLLSYLNPETVQHALVNSNTTGFACFMFLAIYFISRFAIVPKEEKPLPLLKTKV